MASLVPTLNSTLSRLTLLPRSSLYHRTILKSFKLLHPQQKSLTPTCFQFKSSMSTSKFSSRNSRNAIPIDGGEELVVLGIETSCDDTAAAVVRSDGEILSQVVSSQADLLAKYGGVAPKMAEEAHAQVIDQVVQEALDKADISETDLTAVAVTIGPGLSLCVRGKIGVQKARKIAASYKLSMVGVHHMEAHTLVASERDLQFPFMGLLISGGHNLLILAHDLGQYIQLGTTVDDAVGEAYDKTAKLLGLDLRRSGGPAIEDLARHGDAGSFKFTVPMKQHKDCNFSYAGLKNQVRLAIQSNNINAEIPLSSASKQEQALRADIAASFQRVAVLHLEEKCERAIQWALEIEPTIKHLVVSGGVASNQYVRARLNEVAKKNGLQLVCPPPSLCTDNGVMVAWTGIEHFWMGRFDPPPPSIEPEDAHVWLLLFAHFSEVSRSWLLDLRPRWPLGEEYSRGKSESGYLRSARVHPSLTSLIQASKQQHNS